MSASFIFDHRRSEALTGQPDASPWMVDTKLDLVWELLIRLRLRQVRGVSKKEHRVWGFDRSSNVRSILAHDVEVGMQIPTCR